MKTICNIIWFVLGGFIVSLLYLLLSIICCLTIIGIPLGKAFFRLSRLTVWPFGREVITDYNEHPAGNVVWLALCGADMAIGYAILGGILCITIVGIPFAIQCFKLMRLSALPFGAVID